MDQLNYVGVRIEIAERFISDKNFLNKYNAVNNDTKLFELQNNGKIIVEKKEKMIIVHGGKNDKQGKSGLVNFSVMTEVDSIDEAKRIVKIINVLGNDRIIKERVLTFVNNQSLLNALPELKKIKDAFVCLDKIIPGFMKIACYYAPEVKY